MSLPSDLQAAISNLQSKHSGLVAAVRGYSGGSVATRTNTKLAEHRTGVKAMDVRTASLRRQIGQFEDTLLLDFVNSMYLSGEGGLDRAYKLQDLVSFSRASIGTYFGSDGLLKTAAANEPRINFDPVTGECRGLLIEESRTNLLTHSSGFANAAWAKTGINSGSAIDAPDGSVSAIKMIPTATTGSHFAAGAVTANDNADVTVSFFAKKGEYQHFILQGKTKDNQYPAVSFNLDTGVITPGSMAGSAKVGMQSVGNGFYRCWLTWNVLTGAQGLQFFLSCRGDSNSTNVNFTGDGTSGIYIWGAQLEVGAFPTSYIPTTNAQVTRAADVASVNTLSPWFNPDEGVIVVEGLAASGTGSSAQHLAVFTDSSPINNALGLYRGSSGNLGSFIYAGGSAQHDTNDAPTIAGGALVKAALAYKAGDSARCHSGLPPVSVHAGVLPAVTSLRLGSRSDGVGAWNGHIRRLSYTPRRPSNAELQVLTA